MTLSVRCPYIITCHTCHGAIGTASEETSVIHYQCFQCRARVCVQEDIEAERLERAEQEQP